MERLPRVNYWSTSAVRRGRQLVTQTKSNPVETCKAKSKATALGSKRIVKRSLLHVLMNLLCMYV